MAGCPFDRRNGKNRFWGFGLSEVGGTQDPPSSSPSNCGRLTSAPFQGSRKKVFWSGRNYVLVPSTRTKLAKKIWQTKYDVVQQYYT